MIKLPYAAWEMGEYRAAALAVMTGSVSNGRAVAKLGRVFGEILGESQIFPLNSARVGIRLALEAFRNEHPDRRQVLVPAYICPAVPEVVREAGLTPVPVDVGPDFNIRSDLVEQQLDESVLAVVAAHMYGCPARIGELELICRRKGVYLVDDAAQVIGESSETGRILGTHGQVGVLSFAQSKQIVTGVRGSGGVLLVNDPCWIEPIRLRVSRLSPATGRLGHFLHFIMAYQLGTIGTWLTYYWSRAVGRLERNPAKRFYEPALMSNLDAAIALSQLRRLEAIRNARIRVIDQYADNLGRFVPEVEFSQHAAGRMLTRILVMLPQGEDRPAVQRELRKRGLLTRAGYPLLSNAGGGCEKATEIANSVLELPSHWTMTDREVRRVCEILAEVVDAQENPVTRSGNRRLPHAKHSC